LTVIYSLGLFLSAIIEGIIMISEHKDAYIMHYNILETTIYIEHVRKPLFTLTLDPVGARSVQVNANHNHEDMTVIDLEE
jgi:hypothetical protein